MRKYETLLLLSPELSGDERTAILQNLDEIIVREGGRMLTLDEWGMRELAYPVKNNIMRGYYVRLEFGLQPLAVQELERNIRITEGIFKFVTVKLADEVEATAEEGA